MDFVKREERNVIDEDGYDAYQEPLQKPQQVELQDYQHTSISMEQLHQAMQNSFTNSNFPHNLTIPFSPRQISTLMLKNSNLTRNIHINEIPAHLPRNLSDIELAQSLVNETLTQNLSRTIHDDILARNINESILNRNLNDLDLTHNLGLTLNDQVELSRSLVNELGHNLVRNDANFISNIRNDVNIIQSIQNMNHELNLTQQMSSRNEIDGRRTLVLHNQSLIDQNVTERSQNLIGSVRVDEAGNVFPIPLHVKTEHEDEGYYYEAIPQNTFVNNVHGLQGHVDVPTEHSGNIHQQDSLYAVYNNQTTLPPLAPIEIYARPNYIQNYQNANKDNPENLVIHRQYENQSHEEGNLKKINQDGGVVENGAKIPNNIEISEPNENSKPLNKNSYNTDLNLNASANKNDIKVQNFTNNLVTASSIKGEYVCYKCNSIFPSKRSLKQHSKLCNDLPNPNTDIDKSSKYSCSNCSYTCQSPAILKIHGRTHSGEKPFACTFCDYKSGQKNNVAKHILVHMKEKPFACQYCDYRCAQKNNLVVHERTHTGFKPFACTFCDYRTVQKPNLVKHLYLHTDQKPFSCDLCSYRCVQKTNLTKHKQRHYNEKDGEKVDFQNKPYRPRQKSLKCPQCPYKCVQKTSLDKHITFKHADTLTQILESDYESYEQGLNLMKSNSDCVDQDVIQNLSVKKDVLYQRDPLQQDKLIEISVLEHAQLQA